MQSHLVADIGKSIVAAGVFGLPAFIFRIPLLLAYIIAGVVIGPYLGFGFISDLDSISNISEIGLVLLMFILGLEINIKKLMETGKTVLLTGTIQIAGSFFMAMIFFYFIVFQKFNYDLIYISAAVTLSSTLIVVKILSDQMDLDSLPSRITLGVLVIQDIFAIAFLAVQPNLVDLNVMQIFISLFRVSLLVFVSWVLAKYVLPYVFKVSGKNSELLLILAMGWCFSMCGFANYLHLSLEMGALIAGISIASFPYHLDVAAKIVSLRDFFITLFFVSLGLQIPVPDAGIIKLSLLLTVVIFFTRMLTIFPVLHRSGFANRASLLPAINLAQLSEFSLVLASIGISLGHINQSLMISFIFAMIFTALISSFMIPKAHDIYNFLNPFFKRIGFIDTLNSRDEEQIDHQNLKPIILLGFFRDSSSLLFDMQKTFAPDMIKRLLVVDFNPEANYALKKQKIKCLFGDISNVDILKQAGIENAELIICSLPDSVLKGTTNLKLLNNIRKISPEARTIMTAENLLNAQSLYEQGATYVYIPRLTGAAELLATIEKVIVEQIEDSRADRLEMLRHRKEILS